MEMMMKVTSPIILFKEDCENGGFSPYFREIFQNNHIDTILAACPWFAPNFASLIDYTKVKAVLLIKDGSRKENSTLKALEIIQKKCHQHNVQFQLRVRPPSSPFMHLKMIIPMFRNNDEKKLYPRCVVCGSVNYTSTGIGYNDEMLVILQDQNSLQKSLKKFELLWENSITP